MSTLDSSVDLATWWAQVNNRFTDGVTPDLTDLIVDTDYGPVVALYLETDRSP